MTTWIFDYEFGFIRRGLAGEILSFASSRPSPGLITAISLMILLLLVLALTYVFVLPWIKGQARIGTWLFALVAITHSATLQHNAYDLGRFDQIGLLLMLACLAVITKYGSAVRLIAVPLLCLVGLLIHEAYFFLCLPVVLAAWIHREKRLSVGVIAVSAGMIAAVLATSAWGSLSDRTLDQYVLHLQARHSFPISTWASSMIFRGTAENVAQTMEWVFRRETLQQHLLLGATLIPSLLLLARLVVNCCASNRRLRWANILLVASALAPLAMYVLGLDLFRWLAAALTNLFIVIGYLAVRDGSAADLAEILERRQVVVFSIVAISLAFGPIGIESNAYPLFDGFWFLPNAIWP